VVDGIEEVEREEKSEDTGEYGESRQLETAEKEAIDDEGSKSDNQV
jgi:hypothetical protein